MFPLQFVMMVVDCRLGVARGSKYNINALRRAMKNRVREQKRRGIPMLQRLQNDNDDLMEIFRQHYADLRREHSEYKDTARKLEYEVAGLRGQIEQLKELNKRLAEERGQFLERYYRLVTQFETIGGGIDRARAGVNDTIGVLRRRLERPETQDLPSLPPAKSLNNSSGQLEEGIAKITATLGGEHRQAAE